MVGATIARRARRGAVGATIGSRMGRRMIGATAGRRIGRRMMGATAGRRMGRRMIGATIARRVGRGMVGAAVAAGVVAGGVMAGRAVAARLLSGWSGGPGGGRADRWHAVTVNRPVEEVAPDGRLPDRLMELRDTVEVQVRPAPGGKGTELLARLRDGEPTGPGARMGGDPRWAVRRALRETRSLLEIGEVLRPTAPPTTEPTPTNAPLRVATAHGREEGRL